MYSNAVSLKLAREYIRDNYENIVCSPVLYSRLLQKSRRRRHVCECHLLSPFPSVTFTQRPSVRPLLDQESVCDRQTKQKVKTSFSTAARRKKTRGGKISVPEGRFLFGRPSHYHHHPHDPRERRRQPLINTASSVFSRARRPLRGTRLCHEESRKKTSN